MQRRVHVHVRDDDLKSLVLDQQVAPVGTGQVGRRTEKALRLIHIFLHSHFFTFTFFYTIPSG